MMSAQSHMYRLQHYIKTCIHGATGIISCCIRQGQDTFQTPTSIYFLHKALPASLTCLACTCTICHSAAIMLLSAAGATLKNWEILASK